MLAKDKRSKEKIEGQFTPRRQTQRDRSDKNEAKKTRLESGWRAQEVSAGRPAKAGRGSKTNREDPKSRKFSAKQSPTSAWRESTFDLSLLV
jgi:hypothetical protein